MSMIRNILISLLASIAAVTVASAPAAAQKRPNVIMLMSDDVGWGDYGVYFGGAALGHPTPNIDRLAKEGVTFTSWYGQASCTAGRASFMTGCIPIRTALSVVIAPGDENGLRAETPTIAEFYQKNGYSTYFSGKWHLGDVPKFYPIEHGFDEMKHFAAYYPGVYGYEDTSPNAHPSPNKAFQGKSHLGNYSDKMIEMDANIGRIMDAIRADAPDTIVIHTADNGAWQDAWPDAGTNPFRGEKGTGFEAGFRVPGIMWSPGRIPAGQVLHEMMSHMDVWPTTATMAGLTPPPHGEWKGNDGKPIYFDGIDNTAYVTGKAKHSARDSWIYTDGETFLGMRYDIGGDPANPDLKIAWKALYSSKDTWLGPTLNLGAMGAIYNLTMDPYEKYDMLFNGAVSTRNPTSSPGRYAGMDNAWIFGLVDVPLSEFNKSIVQYPNMTRFPGGASNDMIPNLQNPKNPLPYDPVTLPKTIGAH
jgi:Sulfatase